MTYSNTTIKHNPTINDWIASISVNVGIESIVSLEPMLGDCSVRKYYLLTVKHKDYVNLQQFVIMQTPIDNSMKRFLSIADFLSKLSLQIIIPKIYAVKSKPPVGYILLSYLGDQLLFKNLNNQTAEANYRIAWQAIANIQITAKNFNLPVMDRRYIKKTLLLFKIWYLKTHLNLSNLFNINNLLNDLENYFFKIFSSQPQVFVHVDYHSKNLLLPTDTNNEQKIGIIDFQDARLGPITYDMVSLLQDAYIIWPENLIEKILFEYHDYLLQHHQNFNMPKQQFLRFFYVTGLQRHLKNLGIFARMKYFYKKPDYLQYIPNLLNYINKTCEKFPDPELIMIKNLLINTNYDLVKM